MIADIWNYELHVYLGKYFVLYVTDEKPNFSDQFKTITKLYKIVWYNMDSMRQSACLVVNPITVDSYGFLFKYTKLGQASDFMTALR